ncbi:MAG TPA: hypothetical protein VIG76_01550 [Amnibacterium sp.]|jgi:hypothetical protein|uniref:hypothetical protein n=1 Tax=Amnibacterium sp. TaxID=1872496 RepID=UPI002F932E39
MAERRSTAFPLDPSSEAFEPFIGEWDTTGVHGMIPDTVLHGQASIDRMQPGGFLRIRSSIREDVGIPAGVAILGGDGDSGRYVLLHHDDRGVTRIYDAAIEGRVLRWWRDAPDFAQRYRLTVAADGLSMAGKGELCQDGSTWHQDLDLTYTRVGT